MAELIYPTHTELLEIEQELQPRLEAGRLGIEMMPIEGLDSHLVEWEQQDSYGGLQQLRGLNGDPRVVGRPGGRKFMYAPGIYGEFEPIDEAEITKRRQWGSPTQKVTIDDLVRAAQERLLERRLNRIELISWHLHLNGNFMVPTPGERSDIPGAVRYTGSAALQQFAAEVSWADHENATPIADLRALKILDRGTGSTFGTQAKLALNAVTVGHLLSNRNPDDLGGYRQEFAATMDSLAGVNTILSRLGIPQVVEYDEGWTDEAGNWTPYIPDLRGVLFGQRRSGAAISRYLITRNANNDDLGARPYTKVIDRGAPGSGQRVPRTVEVHDGHNGGPAFFFPGSVVRCTF